MAFTGKFLGWFGSTSAGCEHDRLGSNSDGRAVIGEGADAGNGIFGGTGHRGTREHEGEAKDETEGPHQIVSVLVARCPPLRWEIDNFPLFPDVCAKSGKWFRRRENCFVGGRATKQLSQNFNQFSLMPLAGAPPGRSGQPMAPCLSFRGRLLPGWPMDRTPGVAIGGPQ